MNTCKKIINAHCKVALNKEMISGKKKLCMLWDSQENNENIEAIHNISIQMKLKGMSQTNLLINSL